MTDPTPAMTRMFGQSVVVVTGAASGIGRSLAILLTRCGAVVHALDLNREGLNGLVEEIGDAKTFHVWPVDVSDFGAYSTVAERILGVSPHVDFLFNNAGVTLLGEAQNLPFERWKWLLDINLMGAIHGTHIFYPRMIERRSGHIVNTASIAGATGYATAAAYTASKAAILEFTRSLRAEAKAYGIRVSAVCPGYVSSGIFSQDRIVGADRDEMIRDLPVGLMSPDDAAFNFLKGVAAKRKTIIFPFSAKFLWHLSCWASSFTTPFHKRFLRVFRS